MTIHMKDLKLVKAGPLCEVKVDRISVDTVEELLAVMSFFGLEPREIGEGVDVGVDGPKKVGVGHVGD